MNKTDEKIMDAALKLFAENGYVGTGTRFIAEEAGFSEMTLFRKFKTKENLFHRVLIKNQKKVLNDFNSIVTNQEINDPKDGLKILFENLFEKMEDNFQFITIIINERARIREFRDVNIEEIISYLGQYLKKQNIFKDSKINSQIFALNIFSFLYFLIVDKKGGKSLINHYKAIDEFINYFNSSLLP